MIASLKAGASLALTFPQSLQVVKDALAKAGMAGAGITGVSTSLIATETIDAILTVARAKSGGDAAPRPVDLHDRYELEPVQVETVAEAPSRERFSAEPGMAPIDEPVSEPASRDDRPVSNRDIPDQAARAAGLPADLSNVRSPSANFGMLELAASSMAAGMTRRVAGSIVCARCGETVVKKSCDCIKPRRAR